MEDIERERAIECAFSRNKRAQCHSGKSSQAFTLFHIHISSQIQLTILHLYYVCAFEKLSLDIFKSEEQKTEWQLRGEAGEIWNKG